MVKANQIRSADRGDESYYCTPCKRRFECDLYIYDHCRDVHTDEWCDRCNWLFVSLSARDSHIKQSTVHWVCYEEGCSNDYTDQETLDRHQENEHAVCIPCWTHFEIKGAPNHAAWKRHQVDKHNMCETCGRRFENENSRTQHQKVHHSPNKDCFGCTRKFTSYSAMMIHLEAGTCLRPFNVTDIDRWTAQCFPEREEGASYICTNCAGRGELEEFRCLSALLQHQESKGCSPSGFSHMVEQMLKFVAIRIRLAPYPAGQALTVLAKLYVDNSGSFQEQLENITGAVPIPPVEKKDGRVRTVSCLLPSGSVAWTH